MNTIPDSFMTFLELYLVIACASAALMQLCLFIHLRFKVRSAWLNWFGLILPGPVVFGVLGAVVVFVILAPFSDDLVATLVIASSLSPILPIGTYLYFMFGGRLPTFYTMKNPDKIGDESMCADEACTLGYD